MKAKVNKILIEYSFWLFFFRALEVFKWTAECIFKCETTKMKLAESIKSGFINKNIFV